MNKTNDITNANLDFRSVRLAASVIATVVTLASGIPTDAGDENMDTRPAVERVSIEDVMSGRVSTRFRPEYDRHLDQVLLSVHSVSDEAWLETNLRAMSMLPVYSSVLLVVPSWSSPAQLERFQTVLSERPGDGKSKIVTSGRPYPWTQDIGEGSSEGFMLGYKGAELGSSIPELGIRTFQHFLPLDGGNLQTARNGAGRRFLLVGSEEFEMAVGNLVEDGVKESARSVARDAYIRTFDAEELLILPNMEGAHIDQMVLCLADGLVATEVLPDPLESERRLLVNFLVEWANAARTGPSTRVELYPADYRGDSRRVAYSRVDGKSTEVPLNRFMTEEQKEIFLRYRADCPHLYDLVYADEYRRNRLAIERRLTENGFSIVHLKTSVWHEYNCQSFVNAMPFRNRQTGKPGIMMPVYRTPGAPAEPVDLDNLTGLNRHNVETLRALGYEVIPVPSHVQLGGNLHCSIYQF